jgi:capsule polysaccharide modification protein KpsS
VGPFFRELAEQLRAGGARVTKVNFNGGDEFFFGGPDALSFRGARDEWLEYFRDLVGRVEADGIVLFGDCREPHRVAIAEANRAGIEVYVFEEGYVRPDFVTLEKGGVNARSSLPRTLEAFVKVARSAPRNVERMGNTFGGLAWWSAIYSWAATLGAHRFPLYEHHKDLNVFRQTYIWGRGGVRKLYYGLLELGELEKLVDEYDRRYFLAPLQVHFDAQVLHSHLGSNEAFVEEVMRSFKKRAPSGVLLVFKHHPLDRPFREYGDFIRSTACEHGIGERVRYVHDLHLPTLLRHARGTVVLNSTVGCSALFHDTPVKVLGRAVYDLEGLTFQGSLDEFWQNPGPVDHDNFRRFRRGLIAMCQINGSFYSGQLAQKFAPERRRVRPGAPFPALAQSALTPDE